MAKRRKLHEVSLESDIRYRGPFSYLGFQILGWICIALTGLSLILKLSVRLDPDIGEQTAGAMSVLTYFTGLSLPFLLIANFSRILNSTDGFRAQLIRNGGCALAIAAGAILVFYRYVVCSIGRFVTDPAEVLPMLTALFRRHSAKGFFAFNLFVDLFLCTMFMFFLNARPKRVFTGKRLILFRLFAVLPVVYEVFSMVLKARAAIGASVLPLWVFPFLTVKPPMTFVVFIILALWLKNRERLFCRHGRTHEEYRAFLRTNRNSLHFSVFLSIILVVAAIADFIMLVLVSAFSANPDDLAANPEAINRIVTAFIGVGFGGSIQLVFAIPFVLLYSYNRIPKNKRMAAFVPLAGIALMIILAFEGIYQLLGQLAARNGPVPIGEVLGMIMTGIGGL